MIYRVFMARKKRSGGRKQDAVGIADALLSALKENGLKDQAIKLEIATAYCEAVGEMVAKRSEPLSFSRGTLMI